jgi:hypothetical protein
MMILILAEGSAHAYIDPGTGSLLWQLLFAAGVGTLFYVHKAIAWIGRLREKIKRDGAHDSTGASSLKSRRESLESLPLNSEDS